LPADTPPTDDPSDIKPVSIADEMRRSYLDYAMSVIVSRALPDARDGLKPVHRRILYSMHEAGYTWNKPYRKSARVVGDVIGKYHPHGDQAVYDALVRMAQDFALRVTLVDGQGNFGSIDGDAPAAMRYTEVRLQRVAEELLSDLDKDTVDFQPNYDGSEREPTVLPARYPNLLVNGAGGIAVGMATNIPPHNLGEVVAAALALIERPDMTIDELTEIVPGPDFPTGATILGRAGIRSAYHSGRGSITMRAPWTLEAKGNRESVVFTEMPYQVNKRLLVERIGELVREKKLEGIASIWDESNREGIRVVIELKRDAIADVVVNQLYRHTALQSSFGANMVALNGGKPQLMTLKDLLEAFLAFREVVVSRRTKHLLAKARDRAHVLVGLAVAVENVDEVIQTIRSSPNPATAKERLMERAWPAAQVAPYIALIDDPLFRVAEDGTYRLSERQATAILELRLQRLTALGREEIAGELETIAAEIRDYLDILTSRPRILGIIRGELEAVRDQFATPRRTEIVEYDGDIDDEDLIQREEMVVTVSHAGYVKRVPLSTYRAQRRGGKGRSGMTTREEDFVTRLFVASTHAPVLLFSSRGIVYKTKIWRLPLAAPQARGKAFVNLLPLQEGERITTIMPLPEDEAEWAALDVMFATDHGTVRRNKLSDFAQVNRNGKIAMKLGEGERIAGVETCTERDDVLLTTARGQCIRFSVDDVRVFKGRDSTGVRGIALGEGDRVISMTVLNGLDASTEEREAFLRRRRAVAGESGEGAPAEPGEAPVAAIELGQERYAAMSAAEQLILTASERGFGKRTSSYEYRRTNRGGKGIVAMVVNDRNGPLVASFPVADTDEIMLVTDAGKLIRVPVEGIRLTGRNTQGVRIINTAPEERVVSVEHIPEAGEGGEADEGEAEEA
jgi:DNA gyrase subunit A